MIHQGCRMVQCGVRCGIVGCLWVLRNGRHGTKGNGDFPNIDPC